MAASRWPLLDGRFSIATARWYRCSMTSLFNGCYSIASLDSRFSMVLRLCARCSMPNWLLLDVRCQWPLLDGRCSIAAARDARWQMLNNRWLCFFDSCFSMAALRWPLSMATTRWPLLDGRCSIGAAPDAWWQMHDGPWSCFSMAVSWWPCHFSMVFLDGRFSIAALRWPLLNDLDDLASQ